MRKRDFSKAQEKVQDLANKLADAQELYEEKPWTKNLDRIMSITRKYNNAINSFIELLIHNLTYNLDDQKYYDIYWFEEKALRKVRGIVLEHLQESNLTIEQIREYLLDRMLYEIGQHLYTTDIEIKNNTITWKAGDFIADGYQIVETGITDGLLYPQDELITVKNPRL